MQFVFGIILLLLSFFAAGPSWAGESLLLSTVEWPPLATQQLESKGLVVEIVQEAYRRAGIETQIVFVPFSRALTMAETGEVDGLVVSSMTEERADYMHFSDWSFANEISFWVSGKPASTYNSIEDLCPGTVGVLRGSHVARKISSFGCLEPVLINSKRSIAQMLQVGRIDYAIEGRRELRYWMKKEWVGEYGKQVSPLSPPLFVDRYHTTLVKTRHDAEALLHAFDKAIGEMREDGTLHRIISSYD